MSPVNLLRGTDNLQSTWMLWMELGRQVLAESINLRIVIGGLSNSALCVTQGVHVNGMWFHRGAFDRM